MSSLSLIFDNKPCELNDIQQSSSELKYSLFNKTEESDKSKKVRKFQSTCFNCLQSDHSIKDCKKSKNFNRIQNEKIKFQFFSSLQQTSTLCTNRRYHDEDKVDKRFKRFKPGVLTTNLRKALNLSHNEVPIHIYKMRINGYPPGWLEYAKLDNSSSLESSILNVFGCDQINSDICDDTNEQNTNTVVDPDKIISFKGFNEPLDERVRDLHFRYNCPPMSNKHRRKNYIKELNNKTSSVTSNKEIKKRKSPSPENINQCDSFKRRKTVHVNNNNINETEEIKSSTETNVISFDDSGIETDCSFELTNNENHSFHTETGTPILSNVSCYTQIPKVENFTKDITPVLYFENLPNATGHFQKLSKVIRNLRNN